MSIAALSILALEAFSQNTSNTPYSQFGLGQVLNNSSVINIGMGGLRNGLRYDNAINISNPASLSALRFTTYEAGAFSNFTKFNSNTASAQRLNVGMSYIKVAFPVSNKLGLSFGLVPLSGIGYESRVQTTLSDTPVTNVYKGDGGLNQFYIATSYEIIKGLSLGVNANYLFGSINRSKANEFPDSLNFYNIRQTNSTYVGSLLMNFGLQYTYDLSDDRYLTFGLAGNTNTSLNATRSTLSKRYVVSSTGFEATIDTVENTEDKKGKILFPMLSSFGASYGKVNQFMIGADISMGQWSNLELYGVKQNLKNTMDVSVGGFFIPKYNAVGNYFKLIEYRLGVNYANSYVNINGENINQYSVNWGFGLPLPRSASRINLGFEYGSRGTKNAGLIQEEFFNVHLGLNFCDKWFLKRKYD